MCNAGFGLSQACAASNYLCLAGRWQKTFILYCSNYIDTQGRGALGPEKRGLERLFNITSNYVTVRLACAGNFKQTVNPQTRIEWTARWHTWMVNIISLYNWASERCKEKSYIMACVMLISLGLRANHISIESFFKRGHSITQSSSFTRDWGSDTLWAGIGLSVGKCGLHNVCCCLMAEKDLKNGSERLN